METILTRNVRKTLEGQDGAAFVDRTKDYAPRSGEDYRPGFILMTDAHGVLVVSALPSSYQDRPVHMKSYFDVLRRDGYNLDIRTHDHKIRSVRVLPDGPRLHRITETVLS